MGLKREGRCCSSPNRGKIGRSLLEKNIGGKGKKGRRALMSGQEKLGKDEKEVRSAVTSEDVIIVKRVGEVEEKSQRS